MIIGLNPHRQLTSEASRLLTVNNDIKSGHLLASGNIYDSLSIKKGIPLFVRKLVPLFKGSNGGLTLTPFRAQRCTHNVGTNGVC